MTDYFEAIGLQREELASLVERLKAVRTPIDPPDAIEMAIEQAEKSMARIETTTEIEARLKNYSIEELRWFLDGLRSVYEKNLETCTLMRNIVEEAERIQDEKEED
jgi:hypothetical protein